MHIKQKPLLKKNGNKKRNCKDSRKGSEKY